MPLLDMLHHMKNVSSTLQISSLNELRFCNDDSDDRLSRFIREFNFYRTQLTGMANELGMLHLSPEAPRECIKLQYPYNQILISLASEEYRAEIRGKKDIEANLLKRRPMPSSVPFPTSLN
jgi:hypothetical protein